MKGGKEARRSNAILHKVRSREYNALAYWISSVRFFYHFISLFFQIITSAIPKDVGKGLIGLVTSRDEIPELLKVG